MGLGYSLRRGAAFDWALAHMRSGNSFGGRNDEEGTTSLGGNVWYHTLKVAGTPGL